jgi:hypothetical protein
MSCTGSATNLRVVAVMCGLAFGLSLGLEFVVMSLSLSVSGITAGYSTLLTTARISILFCQLRHGTFEPIDC